MRFTFIEAYFVFAVLVATMLSKWNLDRLTTVKVRGQELQTNALPWALQKVLLVVTWLGVFIVAPVALIEWAITTIKEKAEERKNGKLGK